MQTALTRVPEANFSFEGGHWGAGSNGEYSFICSVFQISTLKAPGLEALPWPVISVEKPQQTPKRQEGTASKTLEKQVLPNIFFSEPLRATSSHEVSFGQDVVSDSYPRGLLTRWQYIIPGWKNFQHWFVALQLSAFRLFLLMDSSDQHIAKWACFLVCRQRIYPLTFKDSDLDPQKRKDIKNLQASE